MLMQTFFNMFINVFATFSQLNCLIIAISLLSGILTCIFETCKNVKNRH